MAPFKGASSSHRLCRWYLTDSGSGNLYKCKIIFHAADGKKYKTDTLEMKGEIGLGRSMFQPKASRDEALSLR
ncbi:hypothetical protein FACS1894163_09390 [Spirochaetia bacterium]|nr:hypothetical protein FACS1894163_09390 [Spirochaetia bacterium]